MAQQLLDDLVEARAHIGRRRKGLHDFRVALRRLRSWTRAFRPSLRDTVRKRSYRELGAIADASGAARDAEVALAWLAGLELTPRLTIGARHLAARLRRDKRLAMRDLHDHLDAEFTTLVGRLARQLGSYQVNVGVDQPAAVQNMGMLFTDTLRQHVAAFDRAVRSAGSPDDETAAHEARIAGKRLRYLLEQSGDPTAAELVLRFAGVQDALGELHDAHVMIHRIAAERAALADAPRRRGTADARPGLYTLAARTRSRATEAYAAFRQRWDERGDAMLEVATHIAGGA